MKIRVSTLRRLIREELGSQGRELSALHAHTTKQKADWAAVPSPVDDKDMPLTYVGKKFPGSLDAHPSPDGCKFSVDNGSLYSMDPVLGHKSFMIFGKDGQWHKVYNDARKEAPVDRRQRSRSFEW